MSGARALPADLDGLDFAKGGGVVTVVAQHAHTGAVLMVAFADREALEQTLITGEMYYHSRTRGLWHKGATSGNTQRVVGLFVDCDGDAVLAQVVPAGPACHTGATSCFGEGALAADTLGSLDATIAERAVARGGPPNDNNTAAPLVEPHPSAAPGTDSTPRPSYTQRLLADRNLRLKKLGEETAELVLACADGDRERAAAEAADLVYHTLVALHALGLSLADVRRVLQQRRGP
ncbi:MAG TPA: bifunctional phosphoribosyl-AMP cyclohydrolase/phosphoribosyl-ATP diphosphatase HisIE [Gemmatimonadaceae bacterium]|nr:bifunctional phosphoribosyl-AMP cyclohydrolase/phosphoribosyl-ATP diphosphatase HisIE [Gemmatimonadaceae bacterium]